MSNRFSLVSVTVLAVALAACSGPPEDEADVVEETPAAATDAPVVAEGDELTEDAAEDSEVPAEGDAEEAVTPAPTATPTPVQTPKPTPTATRAAVVAQPATFATCMVCHATTPGQNGVGPSLAGVVGRKAGSVSGYSYSDAMKGSNITWNAGNLERYLVDPNAVVSGGTMPAPGVNAAQAKEIVAYLKSL